MTLTLHGQKICACCQSHFFHVALSSISFSVNGVQGGELDTQLSFLAAAICLL